MTPAQQKALQDENATLKKDNKGLRARMARALAQLTEPDPIPIDLQVSFTLSGAIAATLK